MARTPRRPKIEQLLAEEREAELDAPAPRRASRKPGRPRNPPRALPSDPTPPPPALEPEPEGAPPEFASPERSETYEQVWRLQEQLGSDAQHAVVRIQRRHPDGTFFTLRSMPLIGFSEDALADRYGGGTYSLRFYRGAEYLGSSTVRLDPSVQPKPDPLPELPPGMPLGGSTAGTIAPGLDPRAAYVAGETTGLKLLIESQAAMTQGLLAALAGRATAPAAPGHDPLDVGLKIAEIIRSSSAGGEAPSIKELVSDMASTFREGLRFGQLVNAPERDSFAPVLDALVPPVSKAIEAAIENDRIKARGGGGMGRPALKLEGSTGGPASPAPSGVSPAGVASPPVPPMPPHAPPPLLPLADLARAPWLAHLQAFLPEALHWARNGWDAESYVISLVARLPDHVLDELAVATQSGGYPDTALAALGPAFAAYSVWARRALMALADELAPEDDDEGEERADQGPVLAPEVSTMPPDRPAPGV